MNNSSTSVYNLDDYIGFDNEEEEEEESEDWRVPALKKSRTIVRWESIAFTIAK
jgi:hypothetical protein